MAQVRQENNDDIIQLATSVKKSCLRRSNNICTDRNDQRVRHSHHVHNERCKGIAKVRFHLVEIIELPPITEGNDAIKRHTTYFMTYENQRRTSSRQSSPIKYTRKHHGTQTQTKESLLMESNSELMTVHPNMSSSISETRKGSTVRSCKPVLLESVLTAKSSEQNQHLILSKRQGSNLRSLSEPITKKQSDDVPLVRPKRHSFDDSLSSKPASDRFPRRGSLTGSRPLKKPIRRGSLTTGDDFEPVVAVARSA